MCPILTLFSVRKKHGLSESQPKFGGTQFGPRLETSNLQRRWGSSTEPTPMFVQSCKPSALPNSSNPVMMIGGNNGQSENRTKHLATGVSRRQVKIVPKIVKNVNILKCHSHIWTHHKKYIQISTNSLWNFKKPKVILCGKINAGFKV